jgi:hypothetical protein
MYPKLSVLKSISTQINIHLEINDSHIHRSSTPEMRVYSRGCNPEITKENSVKVLIMLVGNNLHDSKFIDNIISLKRLTSEFPSNYIVDFVAISSVDNFQMYDEILSFRYKVVNSRYQLNKVCSFLESCNEKYDWYIKTRPDVEILQSIDFESLCKESINARVREYCGPVKLEFGASIGGYRCKDIHRDECSEHHGNSILFDESEKSIILDDMIYIFHKTILDKIKQPIENYISEVENEWFHHRIWKSRNINLNPYGIKVKFMKNNSYSISGSI